jgi:hypothetical protein
LSSYFLKPTKRILPSKFSIMPQVTTYKEKQFIDELAARLGEAKDWKVAKESQEGAVDLVVQGPLSGKKLFIELQEGGLYGQLPIASILSLNKQKSRLSPSDDLLLVTFSSMPDLLAGKLDELGIMSIIKPSSIEDVLGKIQLAMAS